MSPEISCSPLQPRSLSATRLTSQRHVGAVNMRDYQIKQVPRHRFANNPVPLQYDSGVGGSSCIGKNRSFRTGCKGVYFAARPALFFFRRPCTRSERFPPISKFRTITRGRYLILAQPPGSEYRGVLTLTGNLHQRSERCERRVAMKKIVVLVAHVCAGVFVSQTRNQWRLGYEAIPKLRRHGLQLKWF